MASYTIDVRPRACRSLRQLDPSVRKAIAQVIDGLAADPRPAGVAGLTGHRPYLRVVPSSATWWVVVRQLERWLEQMKNDSGGSDGSVQDQHQGDRQRLLRRRDGAER